MTIMVAVPLFIALLFAKVFCAVQSWTTAMLYERQLASAAVLVSAGAVIGFEPSLADSDGNTTPRHRANDGKVVFIRLGAVDDPIVLSRLGDLVWLRSVDLYAHPSAGAALAFC